MYKSRNPADDAEDELLQNCFDVLCNCLMVHKNKVVFVASEGVELMWIMLQVTQVSCMHSMYAYHGCMYA